MIWIELEYPDMPSRPKLPVDYRGASALGRVTFEPTENGFTIFMAPVGMWRRSRGNLLVVLLLIVLPAAAPTYTRLGLLLKCRSSPRTMLLWYAKSAELKWVRQILSEVHRGAVRASSPAASMAQSERTVDAEVYPANQE